MQNNLSKKALGMSAAALLTILLPRLIRRILKITAGRARFAGREAGFLAWGGGTRRALFCSTRYDPDWDIRAAVPRAAKAMGIALLTLRKGR